MECKKEVLPLKIMLKGLKFSKHLYLRILTACFYVHHKPHLALFDKHALYNES